MLKCLEYDRYVSKSKSVCAGCRIDRKRSLILRGTYYEKCEKEIREFEESLRSGNISIFRGIANYRTIIMLIIMIELTARFPYFYLDQPFEDKNRNRQKYRQSERCLHQNVIYMQPNKLYETVNKMNCQLNRFRLNCPIHNLIF